MKRLICLLIMVLSGCATVPQNKDPLVIDNAHKYTKGQDVVWSAIMEALAEKSIPVKITDKNSGMIETNEEKFNVSYKGIKEFVVSPGIILGTYDIMSVYYTLFVKTENDMVTVKIISHPKVHENNVTKTWYNCQSIGTYEKNLFSLLDEKLK